MHSYWNYPIISLISIVFSKKNGIIIRRCPEDSVELYVGISIVDTNCILVNRNAFTYSRMDAFRLCSETHPFLCKSISASQCTYLFIYIYVLISFIQKKMFYI